MHGTRIPHPHYSDSTNRFYDPGPSRSMLQEPPPAHLRSGPHVVNYPSVVVGQQSQATLTHLPSQTTHQSIADLEREQRERAKERERNSIPCKNFIEIFLIFEFLKFFIYLQLMETFQVLVV